VKLDSQEEQEKYSFFKKKKTKITQVRSVSISPDGSYLLSGSIDKTVRIWKIPDGSLIRTITSHSHSVSDLLHFLIFFLSLKTKNKKEEKQKDKEKEKAFTSFDTKILK